MKKDKRKYTITKYVMASSATEALKLDKTTEPDDVYLQHDEKWKEEDIKKPMGFNN